MVELSPGSVDRRWVPDEGLSKYRERIHKESKFADDYKKLPFKFSKPKRPKIQDLFRCTECGYEACAPKNTVMIICPQCKDVKKVERVG